MADDIVAQYQGRIDRLKNVEDDKNRLISELMEKLNELSHDYMTERLDREREIAFNREVQQREYRLNQHVRQLNALMDRNPFVLVLIDGDGMIFEDALLKQAEQGGKDAAGYLQSAVKDYIHQELHDLPSDCKIVARIYANVKGLSETCHKAGIVDKPALLEEFARGFTRSRHLFDFIDVGSGKDRADDKLSEVFKLHLYDCHCRQILFGCSHDNGYARLLEEFTGDKTCADRITLVEGVPFERELVSLQRYFKHTKFQSIFRRSKIDLYKASSLPPTASRGVLTNGHAPLASPGNSSAIPSSWASTAASFPLIPPPPSQTSQSPQPAPSETSTSSANATSGSLLQNRHGQRVDPEIKYDKTDINRVKSLKMCNVHILRGDCPYTSGCVHGHDYKPTTSELNTLRHIARQQPCRYGPGCEDPKCMYGHRCLGNPCSFVYTGGCRFPTEMHNIDTQVVKRIKV